MIKERHTHTAIQLFSIDLPKNTNHLLWVSSFFSFL